MNISRRYTDFKLSNESLMNNDLTRLRSNYNLTTDDFIEEIIYEIDNKGNNDDKSFDLKLLQSTMTVYAPTIFQKIRGKDSKMINHFKSFDLLAN